MKPVPALAVKRLSVSYAVRGSKLPILRDLSFDIPAGGSFGLVGESGCGKSTTALAVVHYLARNGRVDDGSIEINGSEVLNMDRERLRRLRAHDVSTVYQEPGRALNPTMRVGAQVAEVLSREEGTGSIDERVQGLLRRVQFSDPDRIIHAYPHMLSGGMQQRVVIAMALASNPSLLILDEPTTALDATVGAEILDIVADLRSELGTAVLLISHNLALVSQMCDRVGVLYHGALVEEGPAKTVFDDPRHPYTVGLLRCIPRPEHHKAEHRLQTIPGALPDQGEATPGCVFQPRCPLADARCRSTVPPAYELGDRTSHCFHHERAHEATPAGAAGVEAQQEVDRGSDPFLVMDGVGKTFGTGDRAFQAVRDVSLQVWPGETLGVVGESGSGKTTLARMAIGLVEPDDGGRICVGGHTLEAGGGERGSGSAAELQMVFQNPDAALNRRHTVRRILGRAVGQLAGLRGSKRDDRVEELVRSVKLGPQHLGARPSKLSGGLKQRVAIARSLAGRPGGVICDEPTSALDVSVQASILNLLADLQQRDRIGYLFISHDLSVVQYMSDRVMVMYLGQVMEIGPTTRVLDGPHHPYTEALLSAVPTLEGMPEGRVRLRGEPPSPRATSSGCPFASRCPRKIGPVCDDERPQLRRLSTGHEVRCHLPTEELPTRSASAAPEMEGSR